MNKTILKKTKLGNSQFPIEILPQSFGHEVINIEKWNRIESTEIKPFHL